MPSTNDPDGPRKQFSRRLARLRDPKTLTSDSRVRALVLGLVLGVVAVPAFIVGAGWLPREAVSTAFALGALVLGFAVLSWTGAVMLGPAVEHLQDYMDLGSGWTEAGARQAFAILSAFGFGVMVGSSLASMVV